MACVSQYSRADPRPVVLAASTTEPSRTGSFPEMAFLPQCWKGKASASGLRRIARSFLRQAGWTMTCDAGMKPRMFASVWKFKKQSGCDTFGRRVVFFLGSYESSKSNAHEPCDFLQCSTYAVCHRGCSRKVTAGIRGRGGPVQGSGNALELCFGIARDS